jgi:hypothetical protein
MSCGMWRHAARCNTAKNLEEAATSTSIFVVHFCREGGGNMIHCSTRHRIPEHTRINLMFDV